MAPTKQTIKSTVARLRQEASIALDEISGRDDVLKEQAEGLLQAVRTSFEDRLQMRAPDLDALLALDERLDGLLGAKAHVAMLRERHADAVEKLAEAERAGTAEIDEAAAALEPVLLEAEAAAEKANVDVAVARAMLRDFDSDFLAVRRAVRALDEPPSRESLEVLTTHDMVHDRKRARAARLAQEFRKANGRGYHEVLEQEYVPLAKHADHLAAVAREAGRRVAEHDQSRKHHSMVRMKHEVTVRNARTTAAVAGKAVDAAYSLCRYPAWQMLIRACDEHIRDCAQGGPSSHRVLRRLEQAGLLGPIAVQSLAGAALIERLRADTRAVARIQEDDLMRLRALEETVSRKPFKESGHVLKGGVGKAESVIRQRRRMAAQVRDLADAVVGAVETLALEGGHAAVQEALVKVVAPSHDGLAPSLLGEDSVPRGGFPDLSVSVKTGNPGMDRTLDDEGPQLRM